MKKTLSLVLALTLLICLVAGCDQDVGMQMEENGTGQLSVDIEIAPAAIPLLEAYGMRKDFIQENFTKTTRKNLIYYAYHDTLSFTNPDMLGYLMDSARNAEAMENPFSSDLRVYAEGGYYWLELKAVTHHSAEVERQTFTIPEDRIPKGFSQEAIQGMLDSLQRIERLDPLTAEATLTLPSTNFTVSGLEDAVTVRGNSVILDLTKANVDDTFLLKARLGAVREPRSFVKATATYDGRFTDIATSGWAYDAVVTNFQTGLMNGTSDTTFTPDKALKLCEAIKMAAALRAVYEHETIPAAKAGESWYAPYLAYAEKKGIVFTGECKPEDMEKEATREVMAYLFANALPMTEYKAINSGYSIPDVQESDTYYRFINRLYAAGILTGNDSQHTFTPKASIKRIQAAAILARIADAAQRVDF